jgi:DNA-binding MurR/RpiR family transcriptional regulator
MFISRLPVTPPEVHATVGERVRESLGRLSPAERRVARAILSAYPTAGLETVAQLANRAGVSGATVTRCVSRLGWQSYPSFQEELRAEVQARMSSPLVLYRSRPPRQAQELLEVSLATFHDALEETFRSLPYEELRGTIELLADATRPVSCLGGRFSHILAYYLYAHLCHLRPNCRLLDGGPQPRADQLADVGRRDVFVVFDYRRYQMDTVKTAREAQALGASIVLFTDHWLSPAAETADRVLTSSVEAPSPFDSLLGGLALVETVVAGLVSVLGEEARERIRRLEQLRESLGCGVVGVSGGEE